VNGGEKEMYSTREEMLSRIRSALKDIPDHETPENVFVNREYNQKGQLGGEEIVSLFTLRLSEYQATVKKIDELELKNELREICLKHKVDSIVVPEDLSEIYIPDDVELLYDRHQTPLTHSELDKVDGVITTCALAVAQTGTIILDAGVGQGRRVLSLLPDLHICVIWSDQIVELIPEAFKHFNVVINNEGRPLTFISGPSATSDIELTRVEGVHGPRKLEVLVINS
jgi:L-lactate dehydrogenase complex protein LldG